MKRTGTRLSALSGWPLQQPSGELRSPTTSSFHPYVQWTPPLLPAGTNSALCRCLRLPGDATCEHCPVPGSGVICGKSTAEN